MSKNVLIGKYYQHIQSPSVLGCQHLPNALPAHQLQHLAYQPHRSSDQRIVISQANRNRIRFAEPTPVKIGIGIVRE